ncbi:MAG: hypothetical protein IJD10_00975 [Clostridia bacterium]|nr:hypothetical protein [Clostridia bacterium]
MTDTKLQTIRSSLDRLTRERTALHEKRIAHIGELAELLCDEAGEEEIFFRDEVFAAKYRAAVEGIPLDVSAFNRGRVIAEEKSLSAMERAMLLCRLCDTLGIHGIQGAGTFFDEADVAEGETVSYVRSAMADDAYLTFASAMSDPKVLYGHEFTEVCENVYYDRSAYCLLPVENTADGRLAGFRSLILKYGLKIASICRVKNPVAEEETVFALLKKSLSFEEGGIRYFELQVEAEDLLSLLSSAEACGMKIRGIASTAGSRNRYDLVTQVDEDGFCGFLSLLHLEYPDFSPLGIYTELNS